MSSPRPGMEKLEPLSNKTFLSKPGEDTEATKESLHNLTLESEAISVTTLYSPDLTSGLTPRATTVPAGIPGYPNATAHSFHPVFGSKRKCVVSVS